MLECDHDFKDGPPEAKGRKTDEGKEDRIAMAGNTMGAPLKNKSDLVDTKYS